ncbi:GDP-mannose 4,6-dehydratase [Candidatus Curtissbacteria bacterium]|nr:GDP-mannose 4,6-dehydratase [Candidatus Curtissbacteria bacterium]
MKETKSKSALITGITGQDGSYLAELLLDKGYEVYGVVRRLSTPNTERIETILPQLHLVEGDLYDEQSLISAIDLSQPDEVYNLAAQSFVKTSWNQAVLTGELTGMGVTRMLDALKHVKPDAKFYQASSSEMFGKVQETPQTEKTAFYPRSPYGVAKLYGHWMTINYRESYGMFAVSGILFNHESPRRGIEFVTRKVTDTAARVKLGLVDKVDFGNLDAARDWGFAGDYVEAMWLMLQQDKPDDFVIATGVTHTIKDFIVEAFKHIGIDNWQAHIGLDEKFMRPAEVDFLKGDATKAKEKLGWTPKTTFSELVKMMVDADMEKYRKIVKSAQNVE